MKNAIVVGMPRSGTSFVASIFAAAQYYVCDDDGRELRQSDEHNPTGYWEAEELIRCNAELLMSSGFEHDNTWLYAPITDQQTAAVESMEARSEHLDFLARFESQQPWLWKDPRLCYTLGYWWRHLSDKESTAVLLVKRNPEDIYRSFRRLKWRTGGAAEQQEVMQRIDHHYRTAEHAIRRHNIPHLEVSYERFGSDPNSCRREISDFFQIEESQLSVDFDSRLDRSSLRGQLADLVDRRVEKLPSSLRQALKNLVPGQIQRYLFPFRQGINGS